MTEELTPQQVEAHRIYELARQGGGLSPDAGAELEQALIANPQDVTSRIKLLGYYSHLQFRSQSAKEARIPHIAWFVDNCPEHVFMGNSDTEVLRPSAGRAAYADIKSRWLSQIARNPDQAIILKHASEFFKLNENALAERFLLDGKHIEPENPEWSSDLMHLYKLWGTGYESRALAECERCLQMSTESKPVYRFLNLSKLPEVAFLAGDFDKAEEASLRLLHLAKEESTSSFERGEFTHAAHTILGRIALARNDKEKAKDELAKSVLAEATPTTMSFGPKRELAAELFTAGEHEAIDAWMDQCATFWVSGSGQLKYWRSEISKGENPFKYLLPDFHGYYCLTRMPRAAFNCEQWDKARATAEELLLETKKREDDGRHYGMALHTAHVVLGQLAVRAGDIMEGKIWLAKSVDVPPSARFGEFGPDLSLAADLLKAGETTAVDKFMKTCLTWCPNNPEQGKFREWIKGVAEGVLSPDLLWC